MKIPKIKFVKTVAIDQKTTAERAKAFREDRGATLDEIAIESGISKPHLSKLENMKRTWTRELFGKYVAAIMKVAA